MAFKSIDPGLLFGVPVDSRQQHRSQSWGKRQGEGVVDQGLSARKVIIYTLTPAEKHKQMY